MPLGDNQFLGYVIITKANCWFLPCYVKKGSKTNELRILMSSKNFNVSLRENLYCESHRGKKAVAGVRAGIKHPT